MALGVSIRMRWGGPQCQIRVTGKGNRRGDENSTGEGERGICIVGA